MAQAVTAQMPANVELAGTYTVRLTAIDPTLGTLVAGVTVSALVIYVADVAANLVSSGSYTVTPLLTYTPGVT